MDNYLTELFERDLLRLRDELNNFKNEDNIWKKLDGITNTAGTLALHLLGNLNFCIGTQLGKTGYVRDREREFSATGISREKMVADIEALIPIVKNTLPGLTDEQLAATYPLEFYGPNTTAFYLAHFYGHFNYHLGQINYLRRILEAGL